MKGAAKEISTKVQVQAATANGWSRLTAFSFA
jgi:hypothetical protein